MSFDVLKLEFVTMILEDEGKKLVVYSEVVPRLSWEDIRKQLCLPNRELTIKFTLKPLEEDEVFELEHKGPHLALLGDLRLGEDQDVEAIPTEKNQDQLIDAQRSFEEQELAENKALSVVGGIL